MSGTTITLSNSLIDGLMATIVAKSKTNAVIKALKDDIRLKKDQIHLSMFIKIFTQ